MKRWVSGRAGLIVALSFTLSQGCSAVLDWDSAVLHCEEGACLEGFSCLNDVCVEGGSRGKNAACQEDQQCADGLICGDGVCAVPCTAWYLQENECPAGEYCGEHLAGEVHRGHCVAGSGICEFSGDPCDDDDILKYCVEIVSDVFACMRSCDLSWGDDGVSYSDTCSGEAGQQSCQPLGIFGQLVCRPANSSGLPFGEPCDKVVNSCGAGLACVGGVCQAYCNFSLSDEQGGDQCGDRVCCEEFKYGICREECLE